MRHKPAMTTRQKAGSLLPIPSERSEVTRCPCPPRSVRSSESSLLTFLVTRVWSDRVRLDRPFRAPIGGELVVSIVQSLPEHLPHLQQLKSEGLTAPFKTRLPSQTPNTKWTTVAHALCSMPKRVFETFLPHSGFSTLKNATSNTTDVEQESCSAICHQAKISKQLSARTRSSRN